MSTLCSSSAPCSWCSGSQAISASRLWNGRRRCVVRWSPTARSARQSDTSPTSAPLRRPWDSSTSSYLRAEELKKLTGLRRRVSWHLDFQPIRARQWQAEGAAGSRRWAWTGSSARGNRPAQRRVLVRTARCSCPCHTGCRCWRAASAAGCSAGTASQAATPAPRAVRRVRLRHPHVAGTLSGMRRGERIMRNSLAPVRRGEGAGERRSTSGRVRFADQSSISQSSDDATPRAPCPSPLPSPRRTGERELVLVTSAPPSPQSVLQVAVQLVVDARSGGRRAAAASCSGRSSCVCLIDALAGLFDAVPHAGADAGEQRDAVGGAFGGVGEDDRLLVDVGLELAPEVAARAAAAGADLA